MIKTKIKIDVAEYSAKSEDLRKLIFKDIRIVTDITKKVKVIHFSEYKVMEENVEVPIPTLDENGNRMYDDATGDLITHIEVTDKTEFVRKSSKTVSFDTYNAIATQVLQNVPADASETTKESIVVEIGIKTFIAQEGYYKGQFGLTDFE